MCGKRPRLWPNLDWLCNSVCFHWSARVSSTCMHFSAHLDLAPEQTRRWNMMVETDFSWRSVQHIRLCKLYFDFYLFFFFFFFLGGGGGGFSLLAFYPIGTLLFFLELVFWQGKGWLCLQGLVSSVQSLNFIPLSGRRPDID